MAIAIKRTTFNKKIRREFKRIQRENKEFKGASKKQKRVLAAKDAIRWTNIGLLQIAAADACPGGSGYVTIESVSDRSDEWWKACEEEAGPTQLHEQILERVEAPDDCTVCGVGGLLVAKCMRFDKYEVDHLLSDDMELEGHQAGDGLEDLFSDEQLALIESAFERWSPGSPSGASSDFGDITEEEQNDAANFGERYDDDKQRFLAIMRNIVINEGTFKP